MRGDQPGQCFGQHFERRPPGLPHHRHHVPPAVYLAHLQISHRHAFAARKAFRGLGGLAKAVERAASPAVP